MMGSYAARGAVPLLAVLAAALPARAQIHEAASRPSGEERLVVLDVPYVAQSEALCGGAAVAMLLRYWGERNVRAEDFATLVTPARDGIGAADLVDAVRARGWIARSFRGDEATVRAHLAAGQPIVTLIEVAPDRFHYVVLLAWAPGGVLLHDPAWAPFRAYDVPAFMRAWAATGYWSLLVQPRDAVLPSAVRSAVSAIGDSARLPLPRWSPMSSTPLAPMHQPAPFVTIAQPFADCGALIAQGVNAAVRDDLAAADRMLGDAANRCPRSARVAVERAGLRFRQERYEEAAALAGAAVATAPADTHALRLLAASRFMMGDEESALDAWNRAGTPFHDLTTITGLDRMRFRTVADAIGIGHGQTITSGALRRARRRVLALPAIERARVEYVPLENGLAEIDAAIAERPAYPRAWPDLLALGGRALASGELVLDLVGIAGAGERWRGFWRSSDARPARFVSLSLPGPHGPGVWELRGGQSTESYAPGRTATEGAATRRTLGLTFSDWASGRAAWSMGASVDHWDGRGTFGGALLGGWSGTRDDGVSVAIDLAGWAGGGGTFGRAALAGRAQLPTIRSFETALVAALAYTSSVAPRDLWNGAGTGAGRGPLLRAHPLLDRRGRVSGAFFAPGLFAATFEARRWLLDPVPGLRVGVAGFLDAAAVLPPAAAGRAVDAGGGVRVRLADAGILRLDFAASATERARAFSLGFEPPARAR